MSAILDALEIRQLTGPFFVKKVFLIGRLKVGVTSQVPLLIEVLRR